MVMGFIEATQSILVSNVAFASLSVTNSASSVFSSMISTCNDPFKSVRLTDPDNETASHLEAILEIIAALDGNNGTLQSILARFMNEQVVILAEKYDMTLIILTIRSYLFGLAIQYPPAGGGYCLVAAHMSEWTLCGRLVASLGAPNQSPRGVLMRRMLDWRGWTPEIMATLGKVDSKFVRAVCQAGTKHAGEKNGVEFIEYQGMGRDLAWLMNA